MENRYKSMPSMVVAEKEKTKDWCRQVLNAITSYMGSEGGSYHSSRVKDIRNKGIKVLSYFISSGKYSSIDNFKMMYGKDAEDVDVNQLIQLAKTLNKLFLKK